MLSLRFSAFSRCRWLLCAAFAVPLFVSFFWLPVIAAEPLPPFEVFSITHSNGQALLNWQPFPAAEQYKLFWSSKLDEPFTEDPAGIVTNFQAASGANGLSGFYRVQAIPMDTSAVAVEASATVWYAPSSVSLK